MEELKRRILSDAVVGEGDIIHVDMFLNHCMDINLMEHRETRWQSVSGV